MSKLVRGYVFDTLRVPQGSPQDLQTPQKSKHRLYGGVLYPVGRGQSPIVYYLLPY
jgi:hypothetical protein